MNQGLKYYIDGNLVYTHSGTFAPISNGSDNVTPRFGYVGTGSEAASFKGTASPLIFSLDIFNQLNTIIKF